MMLSVIPGGALACSFVWDCAPPRKFRRRGTRLRVAMPLVVSLTAGLVAAYPANVLLIRAGVKAGLRSPRELAEGR